MTPQSKLEASFWEFHRANPEVYLTLARLAKQAKHDHGKMIGMKALFERVRWEMQIQTRRRDFKLNNNHTAFYARMLMKNEPELAGLFALRKQKIQSSIGPSSDGLPEGNHKV
jgi:hypothetical protein